MPFTNWPAEGGEREFGSVAAICPGQTGKFLGASAVVFHGISEPSTLETLACREALALAADLNVRHLFVTCDCKAVVKEIQEQSGGGNGAIIREINTTRVNFDSCHFSFDSRKSNFEAHILARFSLGLSAGRHVGLVFRMIL